MTNRNTVTLTPDLLTTWATEGFKELRVSTRYRVFAYKYTNGEWRLFNRPIGINTICRHANLPRNRWTLWA